MISIVVLAFANFGEDTQKCSETRRDLSLRFRWISMLKVEWKSFKKYYNNKKKDMHGRVQAPQSANHPPNVDRSYPNIYQKWKRTKTLILAVRIYSEVVGIEFGMEKYAMLIIKSGKHKMTEGIELPTQVKIRRLGENETYLYFGILETDTIKCMKMKDKIKMSISREQATSQNSYQRDKYLCCPSRKILGTILKWENLEITKKVKF